jgi:hypothetical protein
VSISTASRQFALLLTASASFASAQHPYHWTPTQPYADTAHGVSFRVPPTWEPTTERLTTFDPAHNETHPMLMESNDPAPTAVFTADSPYPHTAITGVYFLYSLKPVPDAPSCDKFAASLSIDEDEVSKPHPITFNGVQFTARHSNDAEPNSRRGIDGTLYSTFRSGMCYLFETTATTYDRSNGAADDDYKWAKENHIHPAPWATLQRHLDAIMQTVRISNPETNASTSPNVPMTRWHDPASGVSLQYPSVWTRVKGADDYCGAVVLSGVRGQPKPTFAVEFRGDGNDYANTSLASLAFLFGHVPHSNPAACQQMATGFSEEGPRQQVIHGTTYSTTSGGECGLGHSVDAKVFTTLRASTCYIFEEDFFTARADGARDLTDREMKALDRHLDAIMQSVQWDKKNP